MGAPAFTTTILPPSASLFSSWPPSPPIIDWSSLCKRRHSLNLGNFPHALHRRTSNYKCAAFNIRASAFTPSILPPSSSSSWQLYSPLILDWSSLCRRRHSLNLGNFSHALNMLQVRSSQYSGSRFHNLHFATIQHSSWHPSPPILDWSSLCKRRPSLNLGNFPRAFNRRTFVQLPVFELTRKPLL